VVAWRDDFGECAYVSGIQKVCAFVVPALGGLVGSDSRTKGWDFAEVCYFPHSSGSGLEQLEFP